MFYWILAIAVIISVFSYCLRLPSVRGWIGEARVRRVIGKPIENEKYVINDFRIHTEEGRTAQIDHIVIQKNGIFVIETKNYSGRIYGNEKQQNWTQVLNYGRVHNSFYSPIKQNRTHIYHINRILESQYPITSAVVFVQGNIEFIESNDVYTLSGLKMLLQNNRYDSLSSAEVVRVYRQLMAAQEGESISNREHLANIQMMQDGIANNICPRCGGRLVQRTHNGSSFYGCSNYPNCRFTKK